VTNATTTAPPRFTYEPHVNLGYIVYANFGHVGSVQKRDDGKWWARPNYTDPQTPWPTRQAAAEELHRING
jgi:hypothetical protein